MKSSFDIMGMPKVTEITAKEIEDYCKEQTHLDLIPALLVQLENILEQAFKELEPELKNYNS
jgi:hypothetical protein